LDYCDEEVAWLIGKSSKFGWYLDDIVDWLAHTAFFTGLGIDALVITDNKLWLWLIAAAGTTINSWMNWLREWLRYRREEEPCLPGEINLPANKQEYFLYVSPGPISS